MSQQPRSRFEFASALRLLWRARLLVAVGVVLALLAGAMLAYRVSIGVPPKFESRGHSLGIASAQVLVDSKSSQAVDLGQDPVLIDIPGLIARARLLANLIATSPLRDQIARRAGIDPRTFLATAPSIGFDSPRPARATSTTSQPNVMNVTFNEALPIVNVNAEAADEATAARISSAAAVELGRYLDSLVAQDKVPGAHQLVVKPLGAAVHATVRRGPRRLFAAIGFAFVLGLWCAAIVAVSRFRRGLREVGAERSPGSGTGVVVGLVPGLVAPPPVPAGDIAQAPPATPPLPQALDRPEHPERPRGGVSA
jgi:hypothetical protein